MQSYNTRVEYIWIDNNNNVRSKSRTISNEIKSVRNVPVWNYDGSSTGQANGEKITEVMLKPCAIYNCPFRKGNNKLVICDTYTIDWKPLSTNTRHNAKLLFDKDRSSEPWFGIEQEYFLFDRKTNKPVGFPEVGFPERQGQYYCGVGAENIFGRNIAEEHYDACLYAGLKIAGINAEVAPGQWEYQIGPCIGIESGDQMWVSRYILHRIAEKYNIVINFEPKPIKGDWNGSGCHVNYSTKSMREGTPNMTGLQHIICAIEDLSKKHKEHMSVYGKNNKARMTGLHETASYDKFTYGVATRNTSIRIPTLTNVEKKGYFEDRRPAANMEPYMVTSTIFATTVL